MNQATTKPFCHCEAHSSFVIARHTPLSSLRGVGQLTDDEAIYTDPPGQIWREGVRGRGEFCSYVLNYSPDSNYNEARMNKVKVSIILPALNEAETIGKVIDEIPQAGFRASRI